MQSHPLILQGDGLTKRFGDFTAVSDVAYPLFDGETAGIIGPNGAGKSTFFNLLTGLFPPTAGRITYLGRDITHLRADQRVALGLVRTFQLVSVFDTLSVEDNLILAVSRFGDIYRRQRRFFFGAPKPPAVRQAIQAALERVGIAERTTALTAELSYGDKRKLEIAMALALNPRVLLLDEPLAGLSDGEITEVLSLVRQLQQEQKLTMVIIEHKISRIVDLVSRLSVMHEGRLIADGAPQDVLADPTVRRVYWGEAAPPTPSPV